MFNLSQTAADGMFGWSNVFLVIGAALVLVGTIGIVWSSGIREKYADERISKNEADTARANADAAQANAKAAEAELTLAKYRAPWKLDSATYKVLVEALSIAPKGRVIVKPNFVDMQATSMAKDITRAFTEAGFSGVGDAPLDVISMDRTGLVVAVRDAKQQPKHINLILRALANTDIPVESGYADWVPDLDTVVILVGIRP